MSRFSTDSSLRSFTSRNRYGFFRTWSLIVVIIALVFIFDISIALGVAGAVPYAAAVLVAASLPKTKHVISIAILCSALSILGLFWSPPGGELWKVLTNRSLALGVIWTIAVIAIFQKRMESLSALQSTALESTANPIIIVDIEGHITWSNPAFTRLTGYAATEIVGRNPRMLKSGEHDGAFYEDLWGTILRGEVWRGELTNRRKDGTLYPEEMTITPVRDSAGAISHFVAIKLDISERKHHEKEMQLRSQQLIQTEKMASLGVLASGLAHEINNPNHVIRLGVQLFTDAWLGVCPILDRYYEENGEYEVAGLDYSEIRDVLPSTFADILNATERIKTIVSELRSFARDEPSDVRKGVQMNHVTTSATTLLSNMLKQSTNHFSTHLEKELPTVEGNYQRLEQILINLLQNACQALSNQEQCIRISTRHDAAQNAIVVEVSDEGVGIPPESSGRIMDPFFTTKQASGGTGLGLSVASAIAKEHGAELSISSVPDEGTTARLTIPIDSAE